MLRRRRRATVGPEPREDDRDAAADRLARREHGLGAGKQYWLLARRLPDGDLRSLQVQLARHSSERDRGLHQSALRLAEVEDAGDAEFGAQFLGPHPSLPCLQVMIADCSWSAPSQKQHV